jgi:hypothetical protein
MPGGADVLQAVVAELASDSHGLAVAALSLLLIGVLAVALSTMSALVSASLCTIRYDLLAALWPELAPGAAHARERAAARRTVVVGAGVALVVAVVSGVADAFLRISVASSTFLALVFALCGAQLAFVPLVVGPILGRARGVSGTVGPGWAMIVLGAGAAGSAAAVAVYVATGTEGWLWAAVPACLGSGLVLFALARAVANRPAGKAPV